MFGYVKINKPELKVKEYEAYRGLYCSLCRAMGKHYGILARLTLSYDVTFLLLARLSLAGIRPDFKGGRCPFNPAKVCNYCTNADEQLRYAASVAMMMFYQKVRDNISDSPFFKRLLMYPILPYATIKNKKAKRLYPDIESEISLAMSRQSENEKDGTDSIDRAAHESAHALGLIFSYSSDKNKESAYRFGYGIGKWVYLCDAADDMKKDIRDKSYNPFIKRYGIRNADDITDEIKKDITAQLNMSCALACDGFRSAEGATLLPIVENILCEGTEKVTDKILKGSNVK